MLRERDPGEISLSPLATVLSRHIESPKAETTRPQDGLNQRSWQLLLELVLLDGDLPVSLGITTPKSLYGISQLYLVTLRCPRWRR